MRLLRHARLAAICARHQTIYSPHDGVIDIHKGPRCIRISSHHFDFIPDMARHFEQYAGQVIGENGLVDYSRPRLHRYAASGLEFELSSFPEEQSAIDDYFRWYTPKSGDLVFDVGAYCGVSTYHLSKAVGETGKVIAFEPDSCNFQLLRRNCERHGLTNVVSVQLAMAGKCGTAAFNNEATLGSGLMRSVPRASAGATSEVDTVTLEEACRLYGIPAFIKMDVEGAEVEILEAARVFISTHPIQFTLDTNHLLGGTLTNRHVEQCFEAAGYQSLSSDESGFMTTWARPH